MRSAGRLSRRICGPAYLGTRLVDGDHEEESPPTPVRVKGGMVSDAGSHVEPGSRAVPARRIEVDPERIVVWVNGFAGRHGALTWASAERSLVLSAVDGATAVLEPFMPATSSGSSAASASGGFDFLASWAAPPKRLALILVRRGGYAVGLAAGRDLIAHKVGTRYVQSRTAAGGWSQQRFARRRKNQADGLVGSVIEHTLRIVLASPSDALVVGGDKALVRDVLADARLSSLVALPRRELFDLPDPKLVVLERALRRARAVRIKLSEPGGVVVESVSGV